MDSNRTTTIAPSTKSSEELRSCFLATIHQEARVVAEVGYWPAPKGMFLYWAINKVNWKIYIGITSDFVGRVSEHKNRAAQGSLLPLHAAIRKYGPDNFVFVPIEEFDSEKALRMAEKQAIACYRTQHRDVGYNVADGGLGLGSEGARAVHARPEFRARFLASYPARAIKAAETRRRNLAARHETD